MTLHRSSLAEPINKPETPQQTRSQWFVWHVLKICTLPCSWATWPWLLSSGLIPASIWTSAVSTSDPRPMTFPFGCDHQHHDLASLPPKISPGPQKGHARSSKRSPTAKTGHLRCWPVGLRAGSRFGSSGAFALAPVLRGNSDRLIQALVVRAAHSCGLRGCAALLVLCRIQNLMCPSLPFLRTHTHTKITLSTDKGQTARCNRFRNMCGGGMEQFPQAMACEDIICHKTKRSRRGSKSLLRFKPLPRPEHRLGVRVESQASIASSMNRIGVELLLARVRSYQTLLHFFRSVLLTFNGPPATMPTYAPHRSSADARAPTPATASTLLSAGCLGDRSHCIA